MSETNDVARRDIPGRQGEGKPVGGGSYLVDETVRMMREQREKEQQGHRKLARVNARDHTEAPENEQEPDENLQNDILQHPQFETQRWDGIAAPLNPERLDRDSRREFDNERREQEKEKQLRLGNVLQPSSAPKPQGLR